MKPKVGIFGLSGCWGEQIVILNCEDQLLDILGAVEIVDFLGGSSVNDESALLDIAFVEGSVGSAREEKTIVNIRARAGLLIACGTCACFGGIAAMEVSLPRDELYRIVYGSSPPGYDAKPHRPLSDFVKVDLSIPGCPMEKDEFLRAVACLLNGDPPPPRIYPVCTECKFKENECMLISYKIPCAGPVTAAGCGARCPGLNVGCIGCRGPVEEQNNESLTEILKGLEITESDIRRRLHTFAAPVLRKGEEG